MRKTSEIASTAFGAIALCLALAGTAWGMTNGGDVTMKCAPACNDNLIGCNAPNKPCCCPPAQPGGIGTCSCTSEATCIGSDTGCEWRNYFED